MAQKISLVLGVVMICLLLVSHDVTLADDQPKKPGSGYGSIGGIYDPSPPYGGGSGSTVRGGYGSVGGSYVPSQDGGDSGNIGRGG